MDELQQLFPVWLGQLDQGLSLGASWLSGAAGPMGLLAYLPPLLLVLLSRQALHVALVMVLALVAFAVFRLHEPALGLVLHVASYVVAVQAFAARLQRRRADASAVKIARLQHEVSSFLDGLDRRSRDADRFRQATVEAQPQREREPA